MQAPPSSTGTASPTTKGAATAVRGTSWPGVALQLLLSHLLAGGAALGTFLLLAHSGWGQSLTLLMAITVGGLVGLLATAWLQYNLYVVELLLKHLAQGLPVEALTSGTPSGRLPWRWPLISLFLVVRQVGGQIKAFAQREQLTLEYRDRLLQQTSEAAALEERNRIARDLHDSIKQQIFSISMSAAAARAHWDGKSTDAREAVEDIQRSVKEAQVELSALLQQLRSAPLENTSLVEALHTQAQALGFRSGARMVVEIDELPATDRLPAGAQEMIFRIVQETFANIARHARANTVWLRLYQQHEAHKGTSYTPQDDTLHVEIRDDGQGFDPATVRKGMGLANLHERAKTLLGTIEIQSAPGQGTTVHVSIPLLQPLQTLQELEEVRRETEHAVEQARSGFQLSANTSLLTAGLLLITAIYNPLALNTSLFWGVCLGALVALYGYAQGRYYSTRVALNIAENTLERLSLKQLTHNAHLWFLRILLIGDWVLFTLLQGWRTSTGWLLVLGIMLVLFVCFIIVRQIHSRVLDRYYQLLPEKELQWEIQQRIQRNVSRVRIWLLAAGIIALNVSRQADFAFPPTTIQQWSEYAEILGMLFWGLSLLIEYVQARRWRKRWPSERVEITTDRQQEK